MVFDQGINGSAVSSRRACKVSARAIAFLWILGVQAARNNRPTRSPARRDCDGPCASQDLSFLFSKARQRLDGSAIAKRPRLRPPRGSSPAALPGSPEAPERTVVAQVPQGQNGPPTQEDDDLAKPGAPRTRGSPRSPTLPSPISARLRSVVEQASNGPTARRQPIRRDQRRAFAHSLTGCPEGNEDGNSPGVAVSTIASANALAAPPMNLVSSSTWQATPHTRLS